MKLTFVSDENGCVKSVTDEQGRKVLNIRAADIKLRANEPAVAEIDITPVVDITADAKNGEVEMIADSLHDLLIDRGFRDAAAVMKSDAAHNSILNLLLQR